jgi:hypothetical protein
MENSEKKKYFPYPSDRPAKKFYIITNDNKKVYFGQTGYEHFTEGHLDERRKWAYISRHRRNENWSNPDTAGFLGLSLSVALSYIRAGNEEN